jgi:FkbH-like protein
MEVSIQGADDFSIPRISQLIQRTNQFNLTTKRYSEAEIKEMTFSQDAEVRHLHLKDRFGDMGLVGVAILRYQGKESVIDSFLLSCRVIGRGVEEVLLADCILRSRTRGCDELIGYYLPTKKNGQVEDFYPKQGFNLVGESSDAMRYSYSLKKVSLEVPDYFKSTKGLGI